MPMILSKFSQSKLWRHKWKILAFMPFVLPVVIYTGYQLYCNYVNERAIKNLHTFVQEWEAKGEITDLDLLYPPLKSPEDDFYSHPSFLAELNHTHTTAFSDVFGVGIPELKTEDEINSRSHKKGYSKGYLSDIKLWLDPPQSSLSEKEIALHILDLLKPFDQRLNSLAEASKRPFAYHEKPLDNYEQSLEKFRTYQSASTLLARRATLRLSAGYNNLALLDILAILRITQHASTSNSLIGQTMAVIQYYILSGTMHEALSRHAFTDDELKRLDIELSKLEPHQRIVSAFRTEIAYGCSVLKDLINDPEYLKPPFETPDFPFSTTSLDDWKEYGEKFIFALQPGGVEIESAIESWNQISNQVIYFNGTSNTEFTSSHLRKMLRTPDAEDAIYVSAFVKSLISPHNNLLTAIALERFRLQHKHYPAKLKELVPTFLTEAPKDIFTGSLLHYKIKPDGTPIIYSAGPNFTDDGGLLDDIPWMYPPTP
jgi:hypothetical protein